MFFDLVDTQPQRLALDDGHRQLNFGELAQAASYWAAQFQRMGAERGEHVGLLCENRVEFIAVVLGALYGGLRLIPLNHHLAAPELQYQLDNADIRVLVAERHYSEVLDERVRVCWIDDHSPGAMLLGEALDAPDPDAVAGGMMMYTSGTTGHPRGVLRAGAATVGQQFELNAQAGQQLGLDGSGTHLLVGPMYHAAPLLFALYNLFNGASIYIMRRFDAMLALALIDQKGITHTHVVPTMFVRCLKLSQEDRQQFSLESLRLVLHGAAPIAPEHKQAILDWWGPVLVEYWGGTESGVCTLCDNEDWLRAPGSVGRALPQWEVFAVDDDGARLPAGREGKLYARHREFSQPFVYYKDPAKTEEAYLAPNTITLGDIGHVDSAGFVYIAGRRADLVIRGGVNIYPAEVESVLLQHPLVADAVVFGRADEELGATLHALIQLVPTAVEDRGLQAQLQQSLAHKLARFKHPDTLRVVASIPRNPVGKVSHKALQRFLQSVDT